MRIVCEETQDYLIGLDKDVLVIDDLKRDFVIINDGTKISPEQLVRVVNSIKEFGYNPYIENMSEEAILIKQYGLNMFEKKYDVVVSVGDGGKRFLNYLMNEHVFDTEIINLIWHRAWEKDKSLGFETDIDNFDFKNKKILLIEDVVASGKSLYCVKEEIEKMGGKVIGVVCGIINKSSPIIRNSFVPILSAKKLMAFDVSLDPFWFPPTYSLRHLIYGDEEMSDIYNKMNKYYFHGHDRVEKTIKEIRNEIL